MEHTEQDAHILYLDAYRKETVNLASQQCGVSEDYMRWFNDEGPYSGVNWDMLQPHDSLLTVIKNGVKRVVHGGH